MSLFNNLWGVPIYKTNVNYAYSTFEKDAQDLIDKYIEQSKPDTGKVQVIVEKGKFLENPKLDKIKELINIHALIFRDSIMACTNDLELTSSWLTVNHKGDSHPQHNHAHTIFSVCYYPRAETGSLVLIAPGGKNTWQQEYRMGFKYSEFNKWNSSDWSIPVLSGDIVIFPGWVSHLTTPNESEKSRLMIGANYWLKGHMQFFDDLDSITI